MTTLEEENFQKKVDAVVEQSEIWTKKIFQGFKESSIGLDVEVGICSAISTFELMSSSIPKEERMQAFEDMFQDMRERLEQKNETYG